MEQSSVKQWLSGISYELAFWNNVYRWHSSPDSMSSWSRHGSQLWLDGMDAQGFLSRFEHPVVYDVGCGMSYMHGDHLSTPDGDVMLDIHYVDPLAHFYNIIKRRHGSDMPDIEFGMLEYLSATAGTDCAHLIIIYNALDHSANPMQGIIDALHALKVGGRIYLCHHPNEAEAEHYKGFHKFNITEEDGACIIWNKELRIDVESLLKPYATISTHRLDNGFIVSVIEKQKAMQMSASFQDEQRHALSSMLETMISVCRQPAFATWQVVKYWWYNAIQFFVQSMSWEHRMRLRRLIYK